METLTLIYRFLNVISILDQFSFGICLALMSSSIQNPLKEVKPNRQIWVRCLLEWSGNYIYVVQSRSLMQFLWIHQTVIRFCCWSYIQQDFAVIYQNWSSTIMNSIFMSFFFVAHRKLSFHSFIHGKMFSFIIRMS